VRDQTLLEWVKGGSALTALVKVSFTVCAFIFGLIYRRYLGILGADRRRPAPQPAATSSIGGAGSTEV
jgi:hypothetical protein